MKNFKNAPRTMEEFSKASGVSRPTLSKFFEDPASVKDSTRTRIVAALAKTHYQPNHYARNLNRKRTRTVGIVVPAITDPFYTGLVTRLELILREKGYWPISISPHGRPDLEAEALNTLSSLKVAGALISPLGFRSDRDAFGRFTEQTPCVFIDNRVLDSSPFVGNNNSQSIQTMVDYLCRSGAPPVYMDTPHVNEGSRERLAAYLEAMERNGGEPRVIAGACEDEWDLERLGFEKMGEMIRARSLPDRTLLCANDRIAFGVLAAAHAAGMRVGHTTECDLRVAGHDDHPLSRYGSPALTTMAQDCDAIAERSITCLMGLIEGCGDVARTALCVPAKLMMRASA
jgi:DNA-binding LacI/PurR family transcriptional regulator